MGAYVFGCHGQLGRELVSLLGASGEVGGSDLPEVDVADPAAVEGALGGFDPDIIYNAAAYTDVEAAEDNGAAAFRANEAGAAVVAGAAARRGVPVVYFSTDYVFGGDKRTPYEADDPIGPLGVYARSKAAGEAATAAGNPRHFIIRTAWLYGPGGNHFVEKILRAAASRPELKVVDDEVGSPTYTLDLARAAVALAGTGAYGVYHAVNGGVCSRFEYAREILRLAGVSTPVRPCGSGEFPTKAPRPVYSVLSTAKLERVAGYRMRPWAEALAAYLKRRRDLS